MRSAREARSTEEQKLQGAERVERVVTQATLYDKADEAAPTLGLLLTDWALTSFSSFS